MIAANRTGAVAGRLFGLDALRGIAAMAVAVMHAHVLLPPFPDLLPRGYLAVDFFFVLSGFVMARTYEPRLAGGMSALAFLRARYLRLWPTMVVGGLLFLPFVTESAGGYSGDLAPVIIANLLLIPWLVTPNLFMLNIPAWSIFFELCANLAHGLGLRWLPMRWLCAVCLLSLTGLAVSGVLVGSLDIGANRGDLVPGLFRVGYAYTLGVILWRWRGDRAPHAAFALPALAAMPAFFAIPEGVGPAPWMLDLGFVVALCPAILIGGLAIPYGAGLARFAGETSFPLYAIHFPMFYLCRTLGMSALVTMAVTVLVAWLLARAMELPRRIRISRAG